MSDRDDQEALAALRARGADESLIEKIAASGLPIVTALRAVEAAGVAGWIRRRLWPAAGFSAEERQRLQSVAGIAADVDEMEGGAANARRFWDGPMPWLDGRTPAQALVRRGGLGVIADLIARLKYGIYP